MRYHTHTRAQGWFSPVILVGDPVGVGRVLLVDGETLWPRRPELQPNVGDVKRLTCGIGKWDVGYMHTRFD